MARLQDSEVTLTDEQVVEAIGAELRRLLAESEAPDRYEVQVASGDTPEGKRYARVALVSANGSHTVWLHRSAKSVGRSMTIYAAGGRWHLVRERKDGFPVAEAARLFLAAADAREQNQVYQDKRLAARHAAHVAIQRAGGRKQIATQIANCPVTLSLATADDDGTPTPAVKVALTIPSECLPTLLALLGCTPG